MSSSVRKIKSPVNVDNNEKACIQSLIEKEMDLEESILNEELQLQTTSEVGEQSKMVDEVKEKILNDYLLNNEYNEGSELGDIECQDDDLELRWEDDLEDEATLLKSPIDKTNAESSNTDLKVQDDVEIIKEEALLDELDDDSVPSSVTETAFLPKTEHGLNKPDMMLEIPTQGYFECSDDEGDQMNNLEMSPDEVVEVNNDNSKDIEEVVLLGTDEEKSSGDLIDGKSSETSNANIKPVQEPDSEAETKLAADIITKELLETCNKTLIEQEKSLLLDDNNKDTTESNDSDSKQSNEHKKQATTESPTLEEVIKVVENNKELLDFDNSEIDIDKIKIEDVADEAPEISTEAMNCDVEDVQESIEQEESVLPVPSNIQVNPETIEENITDIIVKEEIEEISMVNNSLQDINIEVHGISAEDQDQVFKKSLENDKSNANVCYQMKDSTNSFIELQSTAMQTSEPQPSTSYAVENSNFSQDTTEVDRIEDNLALESNSPQPSTSFCNNNENSMFGSSMAPNEVSQVSDSLGLLAETSRVIEDDEEHEYDEDGEGDEDDEFDNYEDESNCQVTAENSEDSNAQHSEGDTKLEADKNNFNFTIKDVTNQRPDENKEVIVEEKEILNETSTKGETLNECKMKEGSKDVGTEQSSDVCGTKVDGQGESILMTLLINNDVSEMSEDITQRNAQNCEKYRSQKKPAHQAVAKKRTSSENCRQYRERKKRQLQPMNEVIHTPSTSSSEMTCEPQLITTDSRQTSNAKDTNKPNDAEAQGDAIVDLDESSSEQESDQETSEKLSTSTDETQSNIKDATTDNKEKSPTKSEAELQQDKNKMKSVNENEKNTQMDMEVYNLDSDEEESVEKKGEVDNREDKEEVQQSGIPKCINNFCSRKSRNFYKASIQAINFYQADIRDHMYMCQNCADAVEEKNKEIIAGVKNFKPLLDLGFKKFRDDMVEISDSESESEEIELDDSEEETIGETGAKLIEKELAATINEAWVKYKMDARLEQSKKAMQAEMSRIKKESEELNELLNECQVVTDKLRNDVYATFDPKIVELPALIVFDTPNCSYSCTNFIKRPEPLILKRRRSPSKEVPPKRPAIPLGYTPLQNKPNVETVETKSINLDDDSADISVVDSTVASAPNDLPLPGELILSPLKVGMTVYAMKNAISGSWLKAKIVEIIPKSASNTFTACRVRFEHNVTNQPFKTLPARHLAYYEPPDVRLNVGRRVIALFKDVNKREFFYSGIVAECPNPMNTYRYLIFYDDGYAQYAPHRNIRLVCECSIHVWEEVPEGSRDFLRQYISAYPERPMVRLHPGQDMKTEWRGNWLSSRVVRVDASLVEVEYLTITRREWIYRGSTRLAPLYLELKAAERQRTRAMPRTQPQSRSNMPYVEYTRSDERENKTSDNQSQQTVGAQQSEELRRQRAVAKKSTSIPVHTPTHTNTNLDNICSRVVYYTPKNAVKPFKMVPHICSPKCKRKDVLALKDLRTYNPLAKPLLSGWERQIVRFKNRKEVMYRAPCGRRLRHMQELHKYLSDIQSDMAVDLFDFSPNTHCLAEFVLDKCFVGKKDLSHGKENVPVPCVNYYDDSLPEFCSYNTERTPTAGVPLNLDPEFLCGCDCEDDCEDKTKCACWKMTLEGAKTIGLEGDNVGYVYKRLPEPLPSGIYECNSRCKCKHTCLNRVAQHPLQLKLQVFKTANRGWGIRALNDIPKGAFLCVYAGNLLTDATANLDGLNEGDEYLAELDYIEVVEQMKEGYEEDIPEHIKKLDKQDSPKERPDEVEDDLSSEGESNNSNYDQEDDDFQPGYVSNVVSEFNKRLRRRDSKKDKDEDNQKEKEKEKELVNKEEKETNPEEECITISDDDEVREPSCFTAAAGMGANEFVSKYRSVRTLFGEDEACYIMDAKVQGNIGRYLNHSCSPNVFVQNVFVDTHDPRFPWVAFFALSYIKSGTELTWNYNYDVGSVPGKSIVCKCGSDNCRGRLL